MHRLKSYRTDLLALLALIVLPLIWFAPVLFTGRTLLPFDNLYTFEPWASMQPGIIPHNNLLSDLVLQNAPWKLQIQRTLAQGQIPLWSPQLFTGTPFFAAGQASVAYPLSVLFYVLPLTAAYGWFTALQLAIAGMSMYVFGRVLRLRPLAALFSGVVFQFSGFMIVSVVFTMVIAAASWLPLVLAIIERIIQKQEAKGTDAFNPIPYVAAGVAVIGIVALAGHPEFFYYTLLVSGGYAAVRLIVAWRKIRGEEARKRGGDEADSDQIAQNSQASKADHRPIAPSTQPSSPHLRIIKLAAWLLALALLGIAAGAVQIIPLYELVTLNFREGSASFRQVLEWAWPSRHVLTFALPNIFGNPSHHTWFDLWNLRWQPATVNALGEETNTIFWGIKNYVEGGSYIGIVTWVLAGVAILGSMWRGGDDRLEDRNRSSSEERLSPHRSIASSHHRIPVAIFTGLALLSLLFAFGTLLYAVLFYGLPGWSQLHSPFRWVFPFTISMAILGGIGLEMLLGRLTVDGGRKTTDHRQSTIKGASRITYHASRIMHYSLLLLPTLSILAGAAALAAVATSYFAPDPFISFAQSIVDGSDLAQMAFADGRMFWGYQSVNLVHFGIVAVIGGWLIFVAMRRWNDGAMAGVSNRLPGAAKIRKPIIAPSPHRIGIAIIALVLLDLFAAHGTFNPATDPALSPLRNVPEVVQFVNAREVDAEAMMRGGDGTGSEHVGDADAGRQSDHRPIATSLPPFRFTTFDVPGEKTFNANVGMYYGWQDIRGYDSIIPMQYVEKMNRIADQSGELLYNRIAPLYADGPTPWAALDNPLLDLLNVKYVLTEHIIPPGSWQRIYEEPSADGGTLAVYENLEVFPRAFIVPEAQVLPSEQQPVMEADLRQTVFIEETPSDANALVTASPQVADATISRYTANDVFVDVNLSDRGWLVLTDAYFPGWKAYLRPFGGDESQETELTIHRANGAFRTIYLPEQGQWTVRFVYSPMSFKLGLYLSFLAGMTVLLLLLYWLWGRYYRPSDDEDEVATVAKNSLVPMGLNLANKAIDFAFAMLYVRLLGPDGTGKYAFVVAVYGFFEIISRYGLGTLLTRDVAADKNQSSRYLTNVLGLRTLLWAASMPVLAVVTAGYWFTDSIGMEEVYAIAIFGVAMLFANWADAFSNLFFAFEKMEYPAGLSSAVALLKVALGAAVLLLGWGFVGLAAVSLVMNLVQLIWLYTLVRSTLFKPEWHWDWSLQKWMLSTSGPLMINHLLATIFWRIDLWILRPLAGAFSVGLYSASLKYLDGLNIIPSTFTFAVFPLMSRYAKKEGEGLLRSYILSSRLLLMVSLPLAMTITVLAGPLIFLLGGAEFLNVPDSVMLLGREISYRGGAALALQVIIWSIPIGFVNSVTQFVLIAVNQQGYLTKAFILGVVFNVVGNILVIPRFDYIGAAVITILSEFSLLIPFYWSVKRHVGTVPWLDLVWRPLVSMAGMGGVMVGLISLGTNVWLTLIPGWVLYAVALWALGGFKGEEMAIVGRALPLGRLRRLTGAG